MHKPISLRQGLNLIEQIEVGCCAIFTEMTVGGSHRVPIFLMAPRANIRVGPAFGRASKILMK